MTYRELAARIAAMSPAQQTCTVKFLEPYDSAKIHVPGLRLNASGNGESITDEDGEEIRPDEPYLY